MKLQHRYFYIQTILLTLLSMQAVASERFYIKGDYLLMKLQQDGISYGSRYEGSTSTATSVTTSLLSSQELYFPFDFRSGFRILLGWEEPCTLWGVKGSWDYLYSTAHGHEKSFTNPLAGGGVTGTNLRPSFGNWLNIPNVDTSNQSLDAAWKSNFNQVDLYVDRKFEHFRCLGFNLLLGLRLASLDQKIHSDYAISGTTATSLTQAAHQLDNLKSQFRGIGVMTGFETHWLIWEGLNLYGSLKGALLYSHHKNTLHALEIQTIDNFSTTFVHDKKDAAQSLKAAFDLGIGLEYSFSLCGWLFAAHTAWEHHIWFNQNRFSSALISPQISSQTSNPYSGDFYYTGWSFGLDLIF